MDTLSYPNKQTPALPLKSKKKEERPKKSPAASPLPSPSDATASDSDLHTLHPAVSSQLSADNH